MKLFRLMGTMTIVAALAATMAVSASALTATHNADSNTISVSGVTEQSNGDYTVVVTSALEGVDPEEGDIYQIDQLDAAPSTIKVPELAAGAYYVRVGGYTDGYDNARVAVKKTVEAGEVNATYDDENATDAVAHVYKVTTDAPTGLVPSWYADFTAEGAGAAVTKKAAATSQEWANIDGNVDLYLIYQGADAVSNVKLIWE